MTAWRSMTLFLGAALFALGCPGRPDLRPEPAPDGSDPTGAGLAAGDGGAADGGSAAGDGLAGDETPRPPLVVVARPAFDPEALPPCESHTACYLGAKEALASGQRAGYLRTVDLCEHYRGRFQLEKFYGMCLLMLADAYRHLNNFEESQRCYKRFLQTEAGDSDLALQARASLDEVQQGAKTPHAYSDYLRAVSLLTRYGAEEDQALLDEARALLEQLRQSGDWALAGQVNFLQKQIAGLADGPAPQSDDGSAGDAPAPAAPVVQPGEPAPAGE